MAQEKLRVIIGGAGIAGLASFLALKKLPNVEVELYEQAPELKEIGASIAINPNVCNSPPNYPKLDETIVDSPLGSSHIGETWCSQCA